MNNDFHIEINNNECKITHPNLSLIFRHDSLNENLQIPYYVRGVGELLERKYDNRIDVFKVEEGNEIYITNFNWGNCRNKNDFVKECQNIFINWLSMSEKNDNFAFELPYFSSFPMNKFEELYEDSEHESLYLSWNGHTLLFIPNESNFDTSRVNVFQIIKEKQLVYRSNFEITNLQGKKDFIATCKKYFRIWCETNQNHNSFDNPIFNDFPWKVGTRENNWWEFDKFAEMHVFTPRTLKDNTQHPLLYPFLQWQKSKGMQVSLNYPESEFMVENYSS